MTLQFANESTNLCIVGLLSALIAWGCLEMLCLRLYYSVWGELDLSYKIKFNKKIVTLSPYSCAKKISS